METVTLAIFFIWFSQLVHAILHFYSFFFRIFFECLSVMYVCRLLFFECLSVMYVCRLLFLFFPLYLLLSFFILCIAQVLPLPPPMICGTLGVWYPVSPPGHGCFQVILCTQKLVGGIKGGEVLGASCINFFILFYNQLYNTYWSKSMCQCLVGLCFVALQQNIDPLDIHLMSMCCIIVINCIRGYITCTQQQMFSKSLLSCLTNNLVKIFQTSWVSWRRNIFLVTLH